MSHAGGMWLHSDPKEKPTPQDEVKGALREKIRTLNTEQAALKRRVIALENAILTLQEEQSHSSTGTVLISDGVLEGLRGRVGLLKDDMKTLGREITDHHTTLTLLSKTL